MTGCCHVISSCRPAGTLKHLLFIPHSLEAVNDAAAASETLEVEREALIVCSDRSDKREVGALQRPGYDLRFKCGQVCL